MCIVCEKFIQLTRSVHFSTFKLCVMDKIPPKFCKKYPMSTEPLEGTMYRIVEEF